MVKGGIRITQFNIEVIFLSATQYIYLFRMMSFECVQQMVAAIEY